MQLSFFQPLCGLLLALLAAVAARAEIVSGDAEISAPAGGSRIVIATTGRVAGAVDSLTYNGKEFIDSFDHGRQLQSAANFDAGTKFTSETFNPTEAGARADGIGPHSTSRLLSIEADGHRLRTVTQMAFWLRPGERSLGNPAKNRIALSNHRLTKTITIGALGMPHVIEYLVTYTVPPDEQHRYAQFEAVTGYMPPEFSRFLAFDAANDRLNPLSDGPGEQPRPVVFATESGAHAMGIFSPDQPSPGYESAGYGRFRFTEEKVVKWNCVFRVSNRKDRIEPGDYTFRNFVIVGSLDEVRNSLSALHRHSRQAGVDATR